jgi:hypothetical protein
VEFKANELILEFANAGMKGMCENTATAQQVTGVLSRLLGSEVKIRCRLAQSSTGVKVAGAKPSKQEQEEVTSDPAVQAVLKGLQAKVLDIQ